MKKIVNVKYYLISKASHKEKDKLVGIIKIPPAFGGGDY
jgi:hypothetical protein